MVRSFHLIVFWILFENVMSLLRAKAAIIGLLEANRVNEWVVTEKHGNTKKQKNNIKTLKKSRSRVGERYLSILVFIYSYYVSYNFTTPKYKLNTANSYSVQEPPLK